jgi:hypothetical protein
LTIRKFDYGAAGAGAAGGTGPTERPLVGKGNEILSVLASKYPMKLTRSQLATQVKMAPRGGGFTNYISILKGNGWATEEDGLIQATEAGIGHAGVTPAAPRTAEEMQAMWRDKMVGKGREIFDFLVSSYPSFAARENIAQAVGMESRGGGFGNYISILKSNGLIVFNGGSSNFIRLSDDLFIV